MNGALNVNRNPARLVVVKRCCVDGCPYEAARGAFCVECYVQYHALNEAWAKEDARLADEESVARRAAWWRLLNVFLVMSAFEGVVAYALAVRWSWRFVALCVAWALVFAVFGAVFGGGVRKGARK